MLICNIEILIIEIFRKEDNKKLINTVFKS